MIAPYTKLKLFQFTKTNSEHISQYKHLKNNKKNNIKLNKTI